MKTKLAVLCSANVCRSPVIEAILQKKIKEAGLKDIEVTSMGTDPECGTMYRDPVMVRLAMNYGYTIEGMNRYMTSEELKDTDLILVMTCSIRFKYRTSYHTTVGDASVSSTNIVSALTNRWMTLRIVRRRSMKRPSSIWKTAAVSSLKS